MKQLRNYPKFTVTQKAERALAGGHPWVYADEVLRAEPCENGAVADVVSEKGRYLGTGLVSEKSKIRVRVFSRNASDTFDEAFWRRRFAHAWAYRKTVLRPEELSCCRVVFGEADFFPGLTVDRFGPVLSVQVLSAGAERLKPVWLPLLVDVLRADGQPIEGVYERNDVAIRALEGLSQYKGWYDLSAMGLAAPQSALVPITENGVRYTVCCAS